MVQFRHSYSLTIPRYITMAAAPQRSVSKEQAFLETYFQCVSKFAYDKAKDLTEKEKESTKTQATLLWSSLLHLLITLVTAEKSFSSLVFLNQNIGARLLGRKDNLKTTYRCLLTELKKIENAHKQVLTPGVRVESLEQLLAHLCGQLHHFVTARIKTIEFYEQMLLISQSKNMSCYEDLVVIITDVSQACLKTFHHPILSPLRNSFSLECDIITHLLQSQVHIEQCHFVAALLQLHEAHTKLATCTANTACKEGKKLGFASTPPRDTTPALYEWFTLYKGALVSKFSLYFYDVLSRQAPPADFKAVLSKAPIDFYSRLVNLQKKSDACSVSLVLDTTQLSEPYRGLSYHHPDQPLVPPTGLDSYPAVFSYPPERAEKHWPSVVSVLTQRSRDLDTQDKLVYVCDEKLQNTYFLLPVEQRITLVVIFETKKAEKDSFVVSAMTSLSSELRCSKVFASLKPGSK